MSIKFSKTEDKITIEFFKIKIKFSTKKNYFERFFYSIISLKFLKDLQINLYRKLNIKHKYKIIPLGMYCLPRGITTFANLKPRRKDGEKTLPFDMAFFYNFDKLTELLDKQFVNFFDDIEYKEDEHTWINNNLNALFIHDKYFTKEDFIARYKRRIANFYEYINDKSYHAYVIIATRNFVTNEQLNKFYNVFKKIRNNKFDIIFINQSQTENSIDIPNFHIINQCDNYDYFKKIDEDGKWFHELKVHETKYSQKIYYEIVWQLLHIMKTK